MKNDKNHIEEILGSLDHCQRAAAPDFFYTRLKARMEKESGFGVEAKKPLILRPVFALAALAVILLINAFVIFQNNKNNITPDTASLSDTDVIQTLAVEYRLNDNSTIPYEINQ